MSTLQMGVNLLWYTMCLPEHYLMGYNDTASDTLLNKAICCEADISHHQQPKVNDCSHKKTEATTK